MKPLQLRASVTKSAGSWAREVALEETWAKLLEFGQHFGLTKMYDLTGIDTLGIPAYSAITPFTNDTISVYHGKGLTPLAAKVSAAMEAFERNAAALPLRPVRIASVQQLRREGTAFLDPQDFHVRTTSLYRDDRPISFIEAWDLTSGDLVLVPHHGAAYGRSAHEPAVFQVITTSGIASGNSIEEAIAHALCEVIERDAVTTRQVEQTCFEQGGALHASPSRPVDLSNLPREAQTLVDQFHRGGVELRVEHVATDLRIPVFAAVALDGSDLGPQVGYGASPHATVALVRAITECAQSRAAELERLREDLHPEGPTTERTVAASSSSTEAAVVRRQVGPTAPGMASNTAHVERVQFTDIPSFEFDDLADDIAVMSDALADAGLLRILVCDLTPPDSPFSAVRVIVPGLETWAFDHSKLGHRALNAWNRRAACIERQSMLSTSLKGSVIQ